MPDYYAELGISRDASEEDISRAFRRLAAKYHPDRNPGDKQAEEKFKRLSEAYAVLKDPKSRAAYDRGGVEQVRADTGFEGFESTADIFSHFGDIFGDLFGQRARVVEPRPEIEADVYLTFDEAASGTHRTLELDVPEIGRPCPQCKGSGYTSRRAREAGGFFSFSRPCPQCGGSGVEPGSRQTRLRTIDVTIPPATQDGTVLRLRDIGILRIHVSPDTRFEMDGLHLKTTVEIPLTTAVLGGQVEVPVFQGRRQMRIPPGTQPGQVFRLAGQGLRDAQGRAGDVFATVHVRVPKNLTDEQRRLFEELKRE